MQTLLFFEYFDTLRPYFDAGLIFVVIASWISCFSVVCFLCCYCGVVCDLTEIIRITDSDSEVWTTAVWCWIAHCWLWCKLILSLYSLASCNHCPMSVCWFLEMKLKWRQLIYHLLSMHYSHQSDQYELHSANWWHMI